MVWKKEDKTSRGESNLEVIRENLRNMPKEKLDLLRAQLSSGEDLKIDKVTPKEWSQTHPMSLACGSDSFYAGIANRLIDDFNDKLFMTVDAARLKRETALALVAYLEDFVCETKVWDTLREMYKATYGEWLPFFNTSHEDYFSDDINIEDLKFITWQSFCRCGQQNGTIYSPYSDAVTQLAVIAYDIFVEVIEKAPQNFRVRDSIKKILKKNDYFEVRSLALWLSTDCKLTAAPWIRQQIDKDTEDLLSSQATSGNIYELIYFCQVSYSWLDYVGMMGCPTNILLARLANRYGFEEAENLIEKVEHLPLSTFEIVDRSKDVVTLMSEAGILYDVNPKSFGKGARPDLKYVTTSITRYGNLWQQDGIAIFLPEDESFGQHNAITGKIPDTIKEKLQSVVEKHDGRRMFYCKNLKQIGKIIDWMAPKPLNEDGHVEADNFLLMVSDTRMPMIMPDICPMFDDEKNPFFKKGVDLEWLDSESMRFFTRACVPDDVAKYIQDNHLLPYAEIYASQGKRVGRKLVQDNLRFLFGFYRVLPANFD